MDYSWSLLKFLKVILVVTSVYWFVLLSILVFLLIGESDPGADSQSGLLMKLFIVVLSVSGGALVILSVAFHVLSQQYFKDSECYGKNYPRPVHDHVEWSELTRCTYTPLTTFNIDFQRFANLDTLVPILCERGVLQTPELECFLEHNQRSRQILCLLMILDKKGTAGIVAVIDCLEKDELHLGHHDLASILQKHYKIFF